MSSQAFSETLQFITNVKLNELNKKNEKFIQHSSQVIAKAHEHADNDHLARLSVFVGGLEAWPGARSDDFNLSNIKRYLEQARRDPGFPVCVIEDWNRQAEAQFDHERTRFDFARLFGMLLNAWLSSSSSTTRVLTADAGGSVASESAMSDSFEKVSRKETIEQKEKLESLIFQEKSIDVATLESYLDGLFSTKEAKEELQNVRRHVEAFAIGLRQREITMTELKQVTQTVLRTDALSEKKQATLKEFLRNPTILEELQSVLNMQLSTIKAWSWPTDGVVLEPRRHLNGRTRFYLDAEILTSLLLHFLGTLWSVKFKEILSSLFSSGIWKHAPRKLSRIDHARRDVFVGRESKDESVDGLRRRFDAEHFFMCQLPSEFGNVVDHYSESGGQHASRKSSVKATGPRFDTPVDLKQSLLHILSADIVFNKALHGKCTVVRTDLEWFGPSLPFDTITTVLAFFGMPDENIEFIKSFLSCPIIFKDDPSKQVRVRKRGVPISYMFSALFGELVMFVMDFAVNQRADGLFLHRIHDDFWFWDVDPVRCATAWNEMKQFATLAGLSFNLEKTGSVVVGDDALHPDLPPGDVRWGFLRMDTASGGRFVVDQEIIDHHIVEMRRQFAATTSVFGWIQAYNKYMAFIVRNCGTPAIVYGKEHVDSIIDTLVRIQKALFSSSADGVEQTSFAVAVAKMIKVKFGVSTNDIPYGWYLWPNAAGGLEVKDPLVDLFLMRDGYAGKSVDSIIRLAHWNDEWKYDAAKQRWDRGETSNRALTYSDLSSSHPVIVEQGIVSRSDPFLSFEEFTKAREERGSWWCSAYRQLLERPHCKPVACTPSLEALLDLLGDGISAFCGSTSSLGDDWDSITPYWQWIIALHHDEMVKKFGSLAVVDPKSVPVGMVAVFKGSRMKWEQ